MIDFTNCTVIPGRAYNGANGSKIAIEYDGEIYMLKFPPSAEGKPSELSYTNSCISEHIASSIFNMLGISAQETILGTGRKTCRQYNYFTVNNAPVPTGGPVPPAAPPSPDGTADARRNKIEIFNSKEKQI